MRRRVAVGLLVASVVVGGAAWGAGVDGERLYRWSEPVRALVRPVTNELRGRKTVEERLEQFRGPVAERLRPAFEQAGVGYPPDEMVFAAFKDDDRLELYARDEGGEWKFVKRYPVLAASGELGPKLREGDRQVPEGVYEVPALNPNSSYHLSIKLNYPNELDRKYAEREGRSSPGNNIFIHGRDASIGCLAMGDPAAEELFVVTALTGRGNVHVVVSPVDFRREDLGKAVLERQPDWIREKYHRIRERLAELPVPSDSE